MNEHIIAIVSVFTTVVLAAITFWYTVTTSKMLKEVRNQLTEAQKQSDLISKAAQIAAWTALTTAAAHPAWKNPYQKLRDLVSELEAMDSSKAPKDAPGSSEGS